MSGEDIAGLVLLALAYVLWRKLSAPPTAEAATQQQVAEAAGKPAYLVPAYGSVRPQAGSLGLGETTYVVRPGDTLSAIAARFGQSLAAVERANPAIADPNLIYPGETVVVPGRLPPSVPDLRAVGPMCPLPVRGGGPMCPLPSGDQALLNRFVTFGRGGGD